MVGRIETPKPSFDDSCSYVATVKEAFQDEPAKYDQFLKFLNDYRAKRIDSDSLVTSIEELLRSHSKLLPGFSVFHQQANTTIPPKGKRRTIPPKAMSAIPLEAKPTILVEAKTTMPPDVNRAIPPEPNRTILTEANEGLGQFQTMVRRGESSELTMDDSRAYIAAVKEAFIYEAEKYKEFLQILKYVYTHREDEAHCYARVRELMKDHPNLLLGFNIFTRADSQKTIPPMANRTIPPEANRTTPLEPIRAVPLQAISAFPPEANRTFHPEAKATARPEGKITIVFKGKRTPYYPVAKSTIPTEANAATCPEEKITIIPKGKRTMAPKAERRVAESNCTKMKRVEPAYTLDFVEKLKTRFRTLDTHVVDSFSKIMNNFREGKMLEKELHREVVDLLYYHEDLIEEFSGFLSQKYSISTT